MPLFLPTAMRFYKAIAILGLLVIISTIVLSWVQIEKFEQTVSDVFEEIITSNMEVDGLNIELQHINKVLQVANQNTDKKQAVTVDDVPYEVYEIERLRAEKKSILLHTKEKELDLVTSSNIKNHVMNEVRLLFIAALAFLLLGTLLTAFGIIGWYFKIELFEDRRKKPR
jgi:hypothetical protein